MKFHDFSPFYRSGEGIRSKVSGDRIIDNPAVADLQSGASFKFDGTDDRVEISTDTNLDMGQGDYSISLRFKADSLRADNNMLFSARVDGDDAYAIAVLTDKSIRHYVFTGGTARVNAITSANAVTTDQWYDLAVVVDRDVGSSVYIDGVAQSLGTNVKDDGANSLDFSASRFIGYYDTGDQDFDGQISQVRLHNRALSAAEVRAAYNGQAVGFEYRGANQTELVYNDFTNDLSSNGWTFHSGVTYDTADYIQFTDVNGSEGSTYGLYYTANPVAVAGKKYKYSFTITDYESGSVNLSLGGGSMSEDYTTSVIAMGDGTYTGEIETRGDAYVRFYARTAGTNTTLRLTALSLTQAGCVAEFLPSGINATQWVDTSGNNLHGTTSTATAVNHEVGALTTVGDIRIGSGSGISFSPYDDAVTGPPGSDSNLLDDYEEGTWTAAFTAGSGGITIDAATVTGYYTKVGNLVTIKGRFEVGSVSGPPSGELTITGLPFAAANPTGDAANCIGGILFEHAATAISGDIIGLVPDGYSNVLIRQSGTTSYGNTLAANVDGDTTIIVSGLYYSS